MNRRDLIRTAFLALLTASAPPLLGMESEKDRRTRRFRELLATPGGRRLLAESMVAPIKTRWDYAATYRAVVGVQPLPGPA